MDPIDLSVITATWRRPKHLAACCAQFQRQRTGGLRTEHVVVSDGPDRTARRIARQFGARAVQRPETGGAFGAFAKDTGISHARGSYLAFWDDDNVYAEDALRTLYEAAAGCDIGVARAVHLDRRSGTFHVIPRTWEGSFVFADVDTMCVCVRRSVALREPWGVPGVVSGTDHHWLARLESSGASIRFLDAVVGYHL